MTTLAEAKTNEQELYEQGSRWLDSTDIVDLLHTLGEVHFVGSYQYRLLVKPDIDLHIINPNPDFEAALGVAQKLLRLPNLARLKIIDTYLNKPKAGEPLGYYLGLKVKYEGILWTMDVWITKPDDVLDKDIFVFDWYKQLTPAQRDTILLLKYQLKVTGRYGGSTGGKFASADVYRAVYLDHVSNLDELDEWRKTHPYY